MSGKQQTKAGWMPAIPEPFYLFGYIRLSMHRCQCDCGRKFRSVQAYREHYAYEHIWAGNPTERPQPPEEP